MLLLKGKMFLDKICRSKVKLDAENREYVEVIVIVNEGEFDSAKAGVLQQNTLSGEERIYLGNLYRVR